MQLASDWLGILCTRSTGFVSAQYYVTVTPTRPSIAPTMPGVSAGLHVATAIPNWQPAFDKRHTIMYIGV